MYLLHAVEALLLWRDPRKSAAVLAGITLAYLLLEWSHLSLLRIVSHSLLAVVTVSFLWNNVASFTNRYAAQHGCNSISQPSKSTFVLQIAIFRMTSPWLNDPGYVLYALQRTRLARQGRAPRESLRTCKPAFQAWSANPTFLEAWII